MPLETATYIVSLVVTNPDGSDQKNTADDHIRLIKACLKRTFPLLDGAVSLSHAQVMRLNDVSASVQLQLNQLRDGSATANNSLFANSASYAVNSSNALSLGGHAAALYMRSNTATSLSARLNVIVNGEAVRVSGLDSYISFYNAAQSIRRGFLQFEEQFNRVVLANEMNGPIYLNATTILHNGVSTVWHAGNDGPGSGLDADLVDGYNVSEAAAGSTVVARTSNAFVYATYFNQSSIESENPNVASIFVAAPSDGFLRKATPAYLGSLMQTRNISGRNGTQKTFSSSAPSGGQDGDIWYRTT